MEIFYLPSELIALGIDDVAKVDPKPSIENDSALEEVALIKHLRLLSKNCQGMIISLFVAFQLYEVATTIFYSYIFGILLITK